MSDSGGGIIVAIDGPAASGKSSTARAVAADLGYRHLDSGAFYRAITFALLEGGTEADRWAGLDAADLARLEIAARPEPGGYTVTHSGRDLSAELRSPEVTANVSTVASLPGVRAWLLDTLRQAGRGRGLVADGRDIGTVVFPDAELKVFLVCDAEERATRRLREQGVTNPDIARVREEARSLLERDRLDQTRAVAPLLRAPDAVVLDTTGLSFDVQVRAITRLARSHAGRNPVPS